MAALQRARILAALVAVAGEQGLQRASVSAVVARSGVSRRTFYELFEDAQTAALAAFEDSVRRLADLVLPVWQAPGAWRERVRASLVVLLEAIERDRGRARLLLVDAAGGGPQVAAARLRMLAALAVAVDEGRAELPKTLTPPPALTGEAVVGGVCAVLHRRLQVPDGTPLPRLASPLTSTIVLPYLGPAAARAELRRPAPRTGRRGDAPARDPAGSADGARAGHDADPLRALGMRVTYRTLRALHAVAEQPGASNRAIGRLAGIEDQGQVSKLLARLLRLGLVANEGAGDTARGAANAWRLTELGERVLRLAG
jgi:AcrR family transcriptional regulator